MCTVSWLHQPDGYHLLCNRDEKRTRGEAVGPRAAKHDGVRYLAPIDFDQRGTWLAVNEYGLSMCLLNGPPPRHPGARSRGHLIPQLIHARDLDHAAELLCSTDLRPYSPHTVLMVQPQHTVLIAHWDGRRISFLPNGEPHRPLTSSSVDPDGARRDRCREFARRLRNTPADLYDFHSSPIACVRRSDAETVSFSWIVVAGSEIRFFYSPAPPCRWAPGEQITLPRAA